MILLLVLCYILRIIVGSDCWKLHYWISLTAVHVAVCELPNITCGG